MNLRTNHGSLQKEAPMTKVVGALTHGYKEKYLEGSLITSVYQSNNSRFLTKVYDCLSHMHVDSLQYQT